ncbi:hypothetical protein EJ419_01080 [Alloscardovia theropitheci]|uniref:Uncharacterized protein n=1 Tax=Alloscardovia theropitheci TaxID=2496842 RepID=A0A4R0QRN0_9BIFI|nr:hypothetical protein [Alloscardovia theropitheci]TCD55013.1 hypothetical protein EJ419_01080 [Alloscardovia theropitheci]
MADGVDGEGMSQVLNDTADESVFEFDDSYQRTDLSYIMDAVLPEDLYRPDSTHSAFTRRGVRRKTFFFACVVAIVFIVTYFRGTVYSDAQTELEKDLPIIFMSVGVLCFFIISIVV